MNAPLHRQAAYRYGLAAEWRCRLYLMVRGYQIVARRYRNHHGEIDLVAYGRRTLCFIEVKARQDRIAGLYALSEPQQQRIVRAAAGFLAHYPKYAGQDSRFDLMVVTNWRIDWIQHAFTA